MTERKTWCTVSKAPIDLWIEFNGDTSTKTLYCMSRKIEEMFFFHHYVKAPKSSIASQTPLKRHGLRLTTLSPETIREVGEGSLDWMPLGNFLDIWAAVMKNSAARRYSVALWAVMEDGIEQSGAKDIINRGIVESVPSSSAYRRED